ncbi:MAG: DUF4886 domain-containing protein [Clostridia bacterium]|nr:DUF4886 domain-containing protein [Clostridia bacterium]
MRLFSILAVVCLGSALMLTACAGGTLPAATTAEPAQTAAPETTADPETTTLPAENNAPPKSLKILAIGNSFSSDAMQYLYQIAADAGVEEIVLGNLYYGGCSLAQHLGFAQVDSPSYKYYKNTTGTWQTTDNYRMSSAIADEDWDYISLQQTSKTCGLRESYGDTMTQLIDYVRARNSTAELIWHMTWAYQQDSTHSSFPNYGRSQQKMYDMIIDVVENCIEPESRFSLIIPCMTSIQNARTSFLGDTLTRDGYHLDYNIGRYIAGLTWYAAITGAPIDDIAYNPSVSTISEDMLAAAKEAVKHAIAVPNAVTQSAITSGYRPQTKATIDPSVVLDPADFYEADLRIASAYGIDLSKYSLFTWPYLENTYWNCTSKAGTSTPSASAGTYRQNVCTAKKYSLSELPLGTVFICDPGWQYRLEIYTAENAKYSGTRPSLSTAECFTLNSAFMGNCKYIAWNIAASPKADISAIYAQAACHVRVYVPKG